MQENLRTSARNVWWAGLGAVASVEKESSQFFDRLVARGREVENRRQRQVKETVKSAADEAESMVDRISSTIERRVSSSLKSMSIPTRSEVRELTRRVERLTELVDRLAVREEEPARKVYHVTPHEDGWKVQVEGSERATRVTETKADAVAAARELAKNQEPSQVVVHRMDGTIQTHYSYGEPEETDAR